MLIKTPFKYSNVLNEINGVLNEIFKQPFWAGEFFENRNFL